MMLKTLLRPRIFVDLDGVLADFDARVVALFGEKQHANTPAEQDAMWARLAVHQDLYRDLAPMPDAMLLWDGVIATGCNVAVLTALPRRTTMPTAQADKEAWCLKHLKPHRPVLTGPYSRDKWKHARPGDILIDDRQSNVTDWGAHGRGHGILHKSAVESLSAVYEILHQWNSSNGHY